MSKFSNDIKLLKQAIDTLEGNSPLIPEESRFNAVIKECVALLRANGYEVKKLPERLKTVKSLKALVDQFYLVLKFRHRDVVPYREDKVDLSIAKALVNKVMELTGLDYNMAINFASNLIDIIFKFEKEFNFEPGSLYSFRIFGQDKMAWVTDKAIRIYNREANNEDELMRMADKATEDYRRKHNVELGYGSVEDIQKLIEKL